MSDQHTYYPKVSPWKRGRDEFVAPRDGFFQMKEHDVAEKFDERKYVNMDLDIKTKRAALKVSASVVGLVASLGEITTFMTSGTVIESSKYSGGEYLSTIVTSASLIMSHGAPASLIASSRDNFKVEVQLSDGSLWEGHDIAYDLHFNVAIVHILTPEPVPAATLRPIDDSISINPDEICRSKGKIFLRPHSGFFKLSPGDRVVAIGRHRDHSTLMVAPGVCSLDRCGFDCEELMMASCRISKSGIGGPLVNLNGDVIGFNFYHELFTPFLAVNVVSKCLEHFKKHGTFYRPWIGLEATNLYAAPISMLDHVIGNFPNVYKGVYVEKVIAGSVAGLAGIQKGDIIVACDGKSVLSYLEFFRVVWDKPREVPLELCVIRKGSPESLKINIMIQDKSQGKLNSWPLPKERSVRVRRIRKTK